MSAYRQQPLSSCDGYQAPGYYYIARQALRG